MLFTLGHSTLQPEEFVAAARSTRVSVIVDVRSHPGSRRFPHFNRSQMEQWLPDHGLEYEWWPALGGWTQRHCEDRELVERMAARGVDLRAYAGEFPKQRIAATRTPTGEGPEWTNLGLYDYSWSTILPEFQKACDRLCNLFSHLGRPHCAMVCAEAVYWRCHRSLIADHLHWRGVPCFHLPIRPPKQAATRRYRSHAEVIGNRLDRYDPEIIRSWERWAYPEPVSEST